MGLAANQTFHREEDTSADQSYLSLAISVHIGDWMSAVSGAPLGCQPEALLVSKRREKSKSAND